MLLRVRTRIERLLAASWLSTAALCAAIGVAYFLSARLGLLLIAQPEDVAVFWPAAGIGAGLLVTLGPQWGRPALAGVMLGTFAANLMGDRTVWSAAAFALCNAGEAMMVAWLLERWFRQPFRLDRLRNVLGFLLAAALAAGTCAVGAAIAMRLFQGTAPVVDIWRAWAFSDGLGIVSVAPLLIELAAAVRDPPHRREQVEGVLALLGIAGLAAFILTLPSHDWMSFEPIAVLFPLLFWIGARCRPVYSTGAVFIIAVGLVWTTTFGIGSFGEPAIPFPERVLAAQMAMLITALCALSLAALFAERRAIEAELEGSNRRLQLALDGAELGVWDVDAVTGRFLGDARHRSIHGHALEPPPSLLAHGSGVHPGDLPRLRDALAAAFETGVFKVEYRTAHTGKGRARQERWVAAEGSLVRDQDGRPLRLLGVTRDITEKKQAEVALTESEARLREALVAGQVMAFEWDPLTRATRRSENAAAILGPDPQCGTGPSSCNFLSRVHPDDRARFKAHIYGLSPANPSYAVSFRFIRPDGQEVWLEETARAEFDDGGRFVALRGLTRDVTARNAAQQALVESERQFRLLVQGVADYAIMMLAPDGSVIKWNMGAERTTGYTADEIIGRHFSQFYPDDGKQTAAEALLIAVRAGRYEAEGWLVRKNGRRFWASVVIDAIRTEDGKLVGFAGVTRDFSERKRFEEHQKLLIAELDHRVKNALARVAIVARRTRETSRSVDEFVAALDGRIQSMAHAHALLSRSHWQGVSFADLVRGELAPYATAGNTLTNGPEIRLTPRATQTIAMVLHELATNAAKYGALSSPSGRVVVNWATLPNAGSGLKLKIDWLESGGPPLSAPPRPGYGTSVIRSLVPHQLDGAVDLAFAAEGVRCSIELPLSKVASESAETPYLERHAGA